MTARRAGLIVAAVLLAVAGVLAYTLLDPSEPDASTGSGGPAAPAPAGSAWPIGPPPSLPLSAAPRTAASVAPAGAVTAHSTAPATPAPFVQTFAAQPGVRPLPALPSPTAPLSMPANVDGCDRGYGTRAQCVPWAFPPGVTDGCAWLAARGFAGLAVTGADRHGLDPDDNGIACDS